MSKGKRIKTRREELNIGQTELAKKIQVSKQTLYKYENDIVTNIPSDKIEMLAKALDTTPAYIMGWDDPDDPEAKALRYFADQLYSKNGDRVLLDLYHNAPDEVQRMVDYLLGYPKPDGEDSQAKSDKD